MAHFFRAMGKRLRAQWVALLVLLVLQLIFWFVSNWLGTAAVNAVNTHAAVWLGLIGSHLILSMFVGVLLFVALCALGATRDELIRKYRDIVREEETPQLAILWQPGASTYRFEYRMPPSDPVLNVHFRICVKNQSKRLTIRGIKVKLARLTPHELTCVPCTLRLMNDLPAERDPFITEFTLSAGDSQFVDLLVQKPGMDCFWILHTVKPIEVRVPLQPYTLIIEALAEDELLVSQRFEVFKDGPLWNMRAVNAVLAEFL